MENAANVAASIRVTATGRPTPPSTRAIPPTFASAAKSATRTESPAAGRPVPPVVPGVPGAVKSMGPPHAAASDAATAARTDLDTKSRRLRAGSAGPSGYSGNARDMGPPAKSERDERGIPSSRVGVLLVQHREVYDHRLPGPPDREAVHPPRGAAGDELAVGLVLRLVLGALEAMIVGQPAERGVLVRAREREGIHVTLEPHQDHLRVLVDRGAVGG